MNPALMFRITGAALGIQLALGGLVTFGFLDPSVHTVWGVILGVLALVTLILVARISPRPKTVFGLTVGIAVDILLQALLGFAALGTSDSNATLSNAIAWVHFLNALGIFAMTLSATFMFMGMARMGQPRAMGPAAQQPA